MKLVTAADVWYTQQQKTLDEIAEKLGVVASARAITGPREIRTRFCSI